MIKENNFVFFVLRRVLRVPSLQKWGHNEHKENPKSTTNTSHHSFFLIKKIFMRKNFTPLFLIVTVSTCAAQEVLHVKNGVTLTIQNGAEITTLGSISLENGSSVLNNGTLRLKNNPVSNQSDWTDNSVSGALSGNGLVIFNSSNTHNFSGTTVFYKLYIDGNGGIILINNLTVNNTLRFINGKINTGSNYIFLNNNNASSLENDAGNVGYINSWVNGNLRRSITANTNTYDFPVANTTRSNLLQFVNNNITGINYLAASFGPKPGTDAGLNVTEGVAYTSVNTGGVWYLNADAAPSGGNYALQLYFNGFTGLADNMFGILRRPDASSNAIDWNVPTGSALEAINGAGRKVSDGYARRVNISTFSQLGIGMSSSPPLPVQLLNFFALRENKNWVKLHWTTATEINNKGFEVERRFEFENQFGSIHFEPTKASGGNSQGLLNYSYGDLNGFSGVTYYRLKQVDIDNHFVHSAIKAVNGIDGTAVDVTIMPNPNKGQFKILISGVTNIHDAFITDINGRIIKQFKVVPQQEVNVQGLPAASYILTIKDVFGKGENFSEKIIILH
jgi:hypothetical protein